MLLRVRAKNSYVWKSISVHHDVMQIFFVCNSAWGKHRDEYRKPVPPEFLLANFQADFVFASFYRIAHILRLSRRA
jgi:hypothetical protein